MLITVGTAAGATLLVGSSALAAHSAAPTATVKTEANLRAEPNTTSTILALLRVDTSVEVVCWARGESTYGPDRFGSMWLYITRGGWVHSFLVTPVDVDRCGASAGAGHGTGAVPELPLGFYVDCDHAIAAGAAPVYRHEPGYGPHLDRDRDGVGCEWDD